MTIISNAYLNLAGLFVNQRLLFVKHLLIRMCKLDCPFLKGVILNAHRYVTTLSL